MLDVVKRAKARILFNSRFFGHLVYQTPIIEARWVRTAATDMRNIYYNPDFFADMSVKEVEFVLLHEILHIVGKHGYRRAHRDPTDWNVAGDYYINLFLVDGGFTMPACGLFDRQYANMYVEKIYDLVHEDKPSSGGGKPGDGNADPQRGEGDQSGSGGGDEQDDQQGANGGRDESNIDVIGNDLLEPADDPSSAEARHRMAEIDAQVAQAATMAKMAGQSSTAMERLVSEVLNPKVPWHEVLAEYATELIDDDVNWSRRNRRYRDACLPGRMSEDAMGEVVVIGDSSGSITNKMFTEIGSEAAGIMEMLNPERLRMIWATTRVVSEEVFERGDDIVLKSPETGGTDMRVPLQHVEQYDPVVVVLITDGHTPWPDEPPYPLIVCCTTDANVPIGQVVRV